MIAINFVLEFFLQYFSFSSIIYDEITDRIFTRTVSVLKLIERKPLRISFHTSLSPIYSKKMYCLCELLSIFFIKDKRYDIII